MDESSIRDFGSKGYDDLHDSGEPSLPDNVAQLELFQISPEVAAFLNFLNRSESTMERIAVALEKIASAQPQELNAVKEQLAQPARVMTEALPESMTHRAAPDMSERAMTERVLTEAMNQRVMAERALTKAMSERALAERAIAERAAAERAAAERAAAQRAAAERAVAERAAAERAAAERAAEEKAAAEKAAAEKELIEKAAVEKAMLERTLTERTMTDRAMAERALAERGMTDRGMMDRGPSYGSSRAVVQDRPQVRNRGGCLISLLIILAAAALIAYEYYAGNLARAGDPETFLKLFES